MSDPAFGIREGEIAVELPMQFDACLYFIGDIRTPWMDRESCPKNAREIGRGVHARSRFPLGGGPARGRELHASHRALLDGPVRGAIWRCRCRGTMASDGVRSHCVHRRAPTPLP